ncbi:MAG: ATP-binding protein [Bacteroidia bacterium]
MLATILRNLLSNAIKFSPEGSTIYVESYNENGWAVMKVKMRDRAFPWRRGRCLSSIRTKENRAHRAKKGPGWGLPCARNLPKHPVVIFF